MVHNDKVKADGMVHEVSVPVWTSSIFYLSCEELVLNGLLTELTYDVDDHPHPSI